MPALTVIGGPNGSGKTTLTKYLIENGRVKTDVINPDQIAHEELGSYALHVKAARMALQRRQKAIDQNTDFTFETTFSGNSEINHIQKAKSKGYSLILYYVALKSKLDNIIRVEQRTTDAGHNVERDDILRRYTKSQSNLEKYIHLFDKAYLFDNSLSRFSRVAIFENGKLRWSNEKHKEHPFYKGLFKP
ncbi:zeta toxin family protein [Mucilaginibacter sp.]|jgi:predicted ABC-type ATPase|uniref:zeta toxin family protein n=1 Tax=Mucilaginibacter sp. TaxID=1882438 RepID=UPI002BB0D410|nr:zeta toxin family protein [Mucilaginibacter sp.]HTI57689.1 zeta toxin family protein [Mucilaginibacter sp.]